MTLLVLHSRRFLTTTDSPDSTSDDDDDAATSDFIIILAALLCAIVCLLGLIAVARCAWIRRFSGRFTGANSTPLPHLHPNKGLNSKFLRKIPKITYSTDDAGKYFDCAICLTEFVVGDVLRALPRCGHGFHVGCIDTWLKSHSSCPSCRQILVDSSCRKCSELTAAQITVAGVQTSAPRRDVSVLALTF